MDALQDAGGEQHPAFGGEPAEQRSTGEDDQADGERTASPEHVAQAATQQEQATEPVPDDPEDPTEQGAGPGDGAPGDGSGASDDQTGGDDNGGGVPAVDGDTATTAP